MNKLKNKQTNKKKNWQNKQKKVGENKWTTDICIEGVCCIFCISDKLYTHADSYSCVYR